VHIVVIGSGLGGLGAALRLHVQGHAVTVIEQRDTVGGRATAEERDGFTLEFGPTMVVAPWLIADLFELAGVRMRDCVEVVPLDHLYTVRFDDGSVFHMTADRDRLIREIRSFNPADVAGYLRFRRAAARLCDIALPLIDRPLSRRRDRIRAVGALLRLRADQSVAALVNTHIRDPRLRQVFSATSLAIGGIPSETTALYTMIHALEQRWGIWYVLGGMGALARALARVYTDRGGTLRLDTGTSEILIDEGRRRATGVRLSSGEVLAADVIVSSRDPASTHLQLVPARARRVETDQRILHRSYALSQVVLAFGTDRRYEHMAHHEVLIGSRYEAWLDDIHAAKGLPSDFSLYLHRPSSTDPTMAPNGCDVWSVRAPVPHLGSDIDWAQSARPCRDAIVQYLESRHLPNLSRHIVTERWTDPRDLRDGFGYHLGSANGLEPTFRQVAWNRPRNQSPDVENLYFVGAGTYPGPGLPAVIASGKIVAEMIGRGSAQASE
jgi:phytoene desaturase